MSPDPYKLVGWEGQRRVVVTLCPTFDYSPWTSQIVKWLGELYPETTGWKKEEDGRTECEPTLANDCGAPSAS